VIHVNDIGLGLEYLDAPGQLHQLEERLAHYRATGFRLVEIDPGPYHLVIHGELHRPSLANWSAVLRQFDLRYSIHGPMRLNLAYDPRHDLCQQIMRCQIEICRTIGASSLVYHSGLQALDQVRYGVCRSLLTEDELAEGARREVAAFRSLAPVASDAGVTIGMENGDTHQWEHDLIARYGLPRSALLQHHARLRLAPIVRQLEEIGHPSMGMTLDLGHLYIAARDLGFDYLVSITEAASWVKHLHISDNLGLLDYGFDAEPDRWAYGEADIHMPPGWGSVPYCDALGRLPGYRGDAILEIKAGFLDQAAEGLHAFRELLRRVGTR
jgi:sugar phosphate isomerase/epimerase